MAQARSPAGWESPMSRSEDQPKRKHPRRRRGIAALAAAATVVGVVASTAAFSTATPARSAAASPSFSLRSAPRYYVALAPTGPRHQVHGQWLRWDDAVVVDTLTGKTVATIQVPKPFNTFDSVAGAADDQTFVLSASADPWPLINCPTKFFVAEVNPSTGAVTLTAPRIPELPKTVVPMGMALSPSGTGLAVSDQAGSPSRRNVAQVREYSLTTGAVRSWQSDGYIGTSDYDSVSISLSGTGKLAFNWLPYRQSQEKYGGIYLLNTTKRGGDLLADSRHVVRFPSAGLDPAWDGVVTADGSNIVVPVWSPSTSQTAVEKFSVPRGRLLRVTHKVRTPDAGANSLEWTSPAGGVFVVGAPAKPGGKIVLGVLSGNRFIPLPGKAPWAPAAPYAPDIAF
jgi:hypothetical protein